MTTANGNVIRKRIVENLLKDFIEHGEDAMQVSNGSIAFPVVAEDGEEGWVELVVKIPRWDEDDDGYAKAEEYKMACELAEEKARVKAEEKARKLAEKQAAKAAKALEKAAKEKELAKMKERV